MFCKYVYTYSYACLTAGKGVGANKQGTEVCSSYAMGPEALVLTAATSDAVSQVRHVADPLRSHFSFRHSN
jgi:hypothetical protein